MATHNDKRKTAVGVFENPRQAQQAVEELKKAGFRDNQIGVISPRGEEGEETIRERGEESYAEEGAVTGAVAGAGVGGLWALGIAAGMLPAIGPVIAGGTLAALLASAAGGAAAGGLVGGLIGAGIPEDEAEHYEREVHAGRTLVTVQADGRYDEALAILRRHRSLGEDMRMSAAHASSPAHSVMADTGRGDTDRTLEVREEELHVSKQPVEKGEVRVRKEVHTEHKTLDVPVTKEEVVVERHPVARHSPATGMGEGDEEIRVPVREEQIHVEKQPVVKEEVHVGKRQVQETEHVRDTIKKEDVKVEREGDVNVGRSPRKRNT